MNELIESVEIDLYLERLRRELLRADAVARPLAGTEKKAAAVLLPLLRRGRSLHLLYTRRSDRLVSHRGQVAFPGGRFDRRDPHLLATALREAFEEVGLETRAVKILGSFAPRRTRSTAILVTPFVGLVDNAPQLRPDPKEVAEIFEVPLKALSDPRYRGAYRWRDNGFRTNRPAILYAGQVIWGLTYDLTLRLLDLAVPPA